MVALEVFFLKLKLFIHTGIAGGIFTLKLQSEKPDVFHVRLLNFLVSISRIIVLNNVYDPASYEPQLCQ